MRLALAILLAASSPAAAVVFEDGGSHLVDTDLLGKDGITVRDGPGPTPTQVTVQAFVEASIGVEDTSSVTVDGGSTGGSVFALDDATLAVVGSDIGNDIFANHTAEASAQDVDVFNNVFALGYAVIDLDDVRIGSDLETGDLFANDSGHVVAHGGTTIHDNVFTNDMAWIELLDVAVGGEVFANGASQIDVAGGSFAAEIESNGTATVRIVGSGFAVDGSPVPFGPLAALSGTLTGQLGDGSPLDNVFARQATATILLVEVPEAGAAALLLAGAAVLTPAARRTRRARRGPR